MIAILTLVLAVELAMVFLLLVVRGEEALQWMVMGTLNLVKGRRKGWAAFTVLVLSMGTALARLYKIEKRAMGSGGLSPEDHRLLRTQLLQVALSGCSLLMAFVINGLHHLVRENVSLKMSVEAAKKQAKLTESEHLEMKACLKKQEGVFKDEMESLKDITCGLRREIGKLQAEVKVKEEEVQTSEGSVVALHKQAEGFLLEYDRLLEDNQNLRTMLASHDYRLSRSDSRKSQ